MVRVFRRLALVVVFVAVAVTALVGWMDPDADVATLTFPLTLWTLCALYGVAWLRRRGSR